MNRCNPFTYLKLTTNRRKGLLWGLAGSSILIVGLCCRHLLQGTPLHLNLGVDWLNLGVLVGFFEEIPFRGLVFQKLNEYMGFWPTSLLGSFLFVCLHIPYWISNAYPNVHNSGQVCMFQGKIGRDFRAFTRRYSFSQCFHQELFLL